MLLLLAALIVLTPFLDAAGRAGVVLAALIAYPVQVVAFGLLVHNRGQLNRWLAVWAGGTVVRLVVVGLVAVFLISTDAVAPVPTLLALAGFFFGLTLVEPVFFKGPARETA